MEIIPAVMPKTRSELESLLLRVRGLVSTVQIDVMDGKFIPNRSWPYHNAGYSDDFTSILHEEDGLPFWEDFDFEVDLMVSDPSSAVEDWILAGARRIIIHAQSFEGREAELVTLVTSLRERFPKELSEEPSGLQIGVAVGAGLLPNVLPEGLVDQADFLQCMGIAKIGFQGQPFDERVLQTISAFRAQYPELPISVDGGVSLDTALRLKVAGATRLVSGSAIFNSNDIRGAVENFSKI